MVGDDAWLSDRLLRARNGDRGAAASFVRDTQGQLRRMIALLLEIDRDGDATVEDLMLQTYERAFAALGRFRGDALARTWLLSIGRRVAADHRREHLRRPPTVRSIPDGVHPDPAETVLLRRAMTGLTPDRREAFVLTQLVGLTYAEAARVCDCPVRTIRSRVARARADLVERVGDVGDADHGNDRNDVARSDRASHDGHPGYPHPQHGASRPRQQGGDDDL